MTHKVNIDFPKKVRCEACGTTFEPVIGNERGAWLSTTEREPGRRKITCHVCGRPYYQGGKSGKTKQWMSDRPLTILE